MKIVVVAPGCEPVVQEIDGTLESMQEIVGGTLQAIYPSHNAAIVFNANAKVQHLPPNREVLDSDGCNEILYGVFFVCGAPEDSNRFVSLTEEQIQHYLEVFVRPEVFLSLGGRIIVLPCREKE